MREEKRPYEIATREKRKRENAMGGRENACYGSYNVNRNARKRERERERKTAMEEERVRKELLKNIIN